MDPTKIPLEDVHQLFRNYNLPVPPNPTDAYNQMFNLINNNLSIIVPSSIYDYYLAYILNQQINLPVYSEASIFVGSNEDLAKLAQKLSLPIDREQIRRVLYYMDRLNQDMLKLELLPIEVLINLMSNLDCKNLDSLCRVSNRFRTLCEQRSIWEGIIRKTGYQGELATINTPRLRDICQILSQQRRNIPGRVYVLGENNRSCKLGIEGGGNVIIPTRPIVDNDEIVDIATGINHSLLLKLDGTLYTTKLIEHITRRKCAFVPTINNVVSIAAGDNISMILKTDGIVYQDWWLQNTDVNSVDFDPIPGVNNIIAISLKYSHTLMLTKDGDVYGIGRNHYEQLGIAGNIYNEPILIPNVNNIISISAGHHHSLLLTSDGRVLGAGGNIKGQLGISDWNTDTFREIPGINNIIAVSAGQYHSILLRNDGRIYVSGSNSHGKLGVQDKAVSIFKLVDEVINVKAISAGEEHSLLLLNDGRVLGAGDNSQGQLGLGNIKEINIFIPIPNLNNVIAISAGKDYSLFLVASSK